VADVGEQVAQKSGGLVEIAHCNEKQPERDVQQVLAKKFDLTLKIEKSELDGHPHVPMLTMKAWFQFFAANSCMHILHGLQRPHVAREESILKAFWGRFESVHPQHQVFQAARSGTLSLSRAVPLVIHGDEGRGRRHAAHFVLSFHSLLGFGFGKERMYKKRHGQRWNAISLVTHFQPGSSFAPYENETTQIYSLGHGTPSWKQWHRMPATCGKLVFKVVATLGTGESLLG
jgi:hypothetical protein